MICNKLFFAVSLCLFTLANAATFDEEKEEFKQHLDRAWIATLVLVVLGVVLWGGFYSLYSLIPDANEIDKANWQNIGNIVAAIFILSGLIITPLVYLFINASYGYGFNYKYLYPEPNWYQLMRGWIIPLIIILIILGLWLISKIFCASLKRTKADATRETAEGAEGTQSNPDRQPRFNII